MVTQPAYDPIVEPPLDATRTPEQAGSLPEEALPLLYRQLHAMAGPRSDLDDLVQAAAERAVRAWPRFRGASSLATWTHQIAYRTFVDELRWFGRWRRRFGFRGDVPPAQLARAEVDPNCPETRALERERARRLRAALDQLPPAKRAVVVLYELEQRSAAEVATIVGANERTVRSRLRDGREQLLRLLRDDPHFDPEVSP